MMAELQLRAREDVLDRLRPAGVRRAGVRPRGRAALRDRAPRVRRQPDATEIFPRLVWHYNEPFADSSAIPSYYLSELTRRP